MPPFSSQAGFQFYGFNYVNTPTTAKVRWGFGWNDAMDENTSEVSGGIGMSSTFGNYSAGDYIISSQDVTGLNRSMRVEMYIR